MSGMTLMLVIGKPVWPTINVSKSFVRVTFFFFAFWILFKDIEVVIETLDKERRKWQQHANNS